MEICFENGTTADLPQIAEHAIALYKEDLTEGTDAFSPDHIQKTFQHFAAHPEKGQIIAFKDRQTDPQGDSAPVIGYAFLVFYWSNEFGGDFVYIDELYVQPDYRSRGVGAAFFQWLETTFRDRAVGFALETTPYNARAMAFYQRQGFQVYPSPQYFKLL